MYRRLPEWVNNWRFPRGSKILDFTISTGEDGQTVEHTGRFIAQYSEAGINKLLRLRFFPLSFLKITFACFIIYHLIHNSIERYLKY